mgnify:CR=1 FL=1
MAVFHADQLSLHDRPYQFGIRTVNYQLCTPVAMKLKANNSEEYQLKEILIEGLLSSGVFCAICPTLFTKSSSSGSWLIPFPIIAPSPEGGDQDI